MRISILPTILFAAGVFADTSDDVSFLTRLVSDAKSNQQEYINYFQTASSIPGEFTSLALEVFTYTDDSYTTLLPDVNVGELESFASDLPWATRLDLSSDDSDSDSDSGSGSGSGASATSGSESTSTLSDSSSLANSAGNIIFPAGLTFVALLAAMI